MGVVLQHRFRPAGERLREVFASGELGDHRRVLDGDPAVGVRNPIMTNRAVAALRADGGGVLISTGHPHPRSDAESSPAPIAELAGYASTTPIHRMETEDMVLCSCAL